MVPLIFKNIIYKWKMIKIVLIILCLLCLADSAYAWLSGYSNRKQITVQADYIDSDLTDFPVYIYINSDTDIGGNMQDTTNYNDIRFTDTSDNVLPYEEERMTISGGSATGNYWVQVDLTSASGATIYCYYGKAGDSDGSNATGVWDSNYKGVWHLGDGNSTDADFYQDSTANDNDGQLTDADGDTVQEDGKIGKAMDFNGDADYISIDDHNSLDLTSLTIEAWINVNAVSLDVVIAKGYDAAENYESQVINADYMHQPIKWTNGTRSGLDGSAGKISEDNWYHVVFSYNGTARITYHNGSQDTTSSPSLTPQTNSRPLILGAEENSAGGFMADRFFGGIIDEVRVSSTDRSGDWIKFEYANMGGQADNELTWGSEADLISPTVTFSPLDAATDVALATNPTITFNEAVRNLDDSALTDSNVDSLITLKENNASGDDIAFDTTINAGKTLITINPTSDFSNGQVVYAAIGATVEDVWDNAISASSTTFTTVITTPTVTTTIVSSVTATTASSGGTVTADGGASVTARGVCWSTSQNPTIADSRTSDGTGTGSFTSSLTGLSPGTTYYVRAYATNSEGTVYGDNETFATEEDTEEDTDTSFWYFAEGTTAAPFTQFFIMLNPNENAVEVTPTFMFGDGTTETVDPISIPAQSRYTLRVNDFVTNSAIGAKLTVSGNENIYPERAMYWDIVNNPSGGGHGGIGYQGTATTWYLAEGCTGTGFNEWVLILNPNDAATEVTMSLMTADGLAGTQTISVPATSRVSVHVNDYISNSEVGIKLESSGDVGIVVERALYHYSNGNALMAGQCSLGATATSTSWYFAEGRTVNGFYEYLMLLNPHSSDSADVQVTYVKSDGTTEVESVTIPAQSRRTIRVNDLINDRGVAATVTSTNGVGIVAERSLYWNAGVINWAGSSCSLGAPATGTIWYFAEGYTSESFTDWLFLYNPGTASTADVTITLMQDDDTVSTHEVTVAPQSRTTIYLNSILPAAAFGFKVESTNSVGIVAERAIYWDSGALHWAGGSCTKGIRVQE